MSFAATITRPEGIDDKTWRSLASMVLPYLEDITPVKTGNMRDSYSQSVSNNGIQIKNLADYAQYVENGNTRGMKPHHLMAQVQEYINSMAH